MVNQEIRPEQRFPHRPDQRVVGVQHREPVAGHGFHDDRLDVGQLLHGVDAPQAEMVGLDVEHHADVVALVAQTLAENSARGHLEDREIDPRILQHHLRRPRSRRIGADDQALVDHHAIGGGHSPPCGRCP
jgi:hypothetical protein